MTLSTRPAGTLKAGRLGVLGGTFDPIHVGHVAAASAAAHALALERVVLVPSRLPPHRAESARTSAEHRLAMAALAAEAHPLVGVGRRGHARRAVVYVRHAERADPRWATGIADLLHHRRRRVRRNCHLVALPGHSRSGPLRGRGPTGNHATLVDSACARPCRTHDDTGSSAAIGHRSSALTWHANHPDRSRNS